MINYGSISQKNDKIYGLSDLNTLNKKMDSLLRSDNKKSASSKRKRGKKRRVQPKVSMVLNYHNLDDVFEIEDFEDIDYLGDLGKGVDVEDKITINERIIELLANKIIQEKENRLQTEIQMNKIRNQNQKQIKALETMLKTVHPK
jgi:hypothetical protein